MLSDGALLKQIRALQRLYIARDQYIEGYYAEGIIRRIIYREL